MKRLFLLVVGVFAMCKAAQTAETGITNATIIRISAASSGNSFAYFRPDLFGSSCNASVWGTSFSIFQIPTKEMLAVFLSAQSRGVDTPFIILSGTPFVASRI